MTAAAVQVYVFGILRLLTGKFRAQAFVCESIHPEPRVSRPKPTASTAKEFLREVWMMALAFPGLETQLRKDQDREIDNFR